MSEFETHNVEFDAMSAQSVSEYLWRHPDFFSAQTDLLLHLRIPHRVGKGTYSLVEYQLDQLRHKLRLTERDLQYCKQALEKTSTLIHAMDQVGLQILEAPDVLALDRLVKAALQQNYAVQQAIYYIFAGSGYSRQIAGFRWVGADAELKSMFAEIMLRQRVLCDSLQDEHIRALFPHDNFTSVRSTLLIPIKRQSWDGLMVLGSAQWNHFQRGTAVDALVHMARLCALSLDRLGVSNDPSARLGSPHG